jgi:hypothetical protein
MVQAHDRHRMTDQTYPPEIMELMSTAFEAAYEQVLGEPSQAFQLQLATRIMAAVNAGVRDHDTLVAIALGEVGLEGSEADGAVAATLPISKRNSSLERRRQA